MKQINLDHENDEIKRFIRSLSDHADGTILKLGGEAVVKVVPVTRKELDRSKLKAAILRRRDESRKLNREWEAVDREMWERIPDSEG